MTVTHEPSKIDWTAHIETIVRGEAALAWREQQLLDCAERESMLALALAEAKLERQVAAANVRGAKREARLVRRRFAGQPVRVIAATAVAVTGESEWFSERPGIFRPSTRVLDGITDGEVYDWLNGEVKFNNETGPWLILKLWPGGRSKIPNVTKHPDFYVVRPQDCELILTDTARH